MKMVKDCPDFPTKVRVGPFDFRIMLWDRHDSNGARRYGETCIQGLFIRIGEDTLLQKAADTLLHEILHACWWAADLDDADKQERTVGCLSTQLCIVWRDSPEVMAWIGRNIQPEAAA